MGGYGVVMGICVGDKFPIFIRFEVFTAVTTMLMFFWVWAPCELAGRSQRFGEEYYLHRQG
jgi:hypothetical protein